MESSFATPWRKKESAFSLYFSLLTGIPDRDGFADTCIHRQTVCSSENLSLIPSQKPAFPLNQVRNVSVTH
jgi:hypothetical protein